MSSYYSTQPRRRTNSYSGRPRHNSGGRKATKQYIHPSKFVKTATASSATPYTSTHSFEDFAVNPLIKANIAKKDFITPTPIQDQTIPLVLEGKDVIGIANTGTGKTAAFGIPLLHLLMANRGDKVLIMAPTRELAEQINEDFRSIGRGSGLYSALLIGGVGIGGQIRELRANPQIIIGTPGRIKDHMERRTLQLRHVNKVVLDEVDRMLDMGFINDIRRILSELPQPRQSLFFSATVEARVSGIIGQFASDPVTVSITTSSNGESVHQDIVSYKTPTERLDKLHDILIKSEVGKTIVFHETKHSVDRLSKELVIRGFKADAIHGGKSQGQRKRALDKFKENRVNILVATDVAARGIDVSDITHVINYSTPQSYDDYLHRIGRAGRAGQTGFALTFVES